MSAAILCNYIKKEIGLHCHELDAQALLTCRYSKTFVLILLKNVKKVIEDKMQIIIIIIITNVSKSDSRVSFD